MDGFKQRIIGALVLVSLAVIFVPMLLDEPHQERTSHKIEMPPEPDFPKVRIEPAEKPLLENPIEPVPEPERAPMNTTSAVQAPADTAPMSASETVRPRQQVEQAPAAVGETPVAADITSTSEEAEQQKAAPQSDSSPKTSRAVSSEQEPGSTADKQPVAQAGAYLVQLGSFGSNSNAKRLMGSVEEAGFSSHTTVIESGGNSYTRVFAGPFADKQAADAAKNKLDSKFGLNTLVIANDD